MNYLLLGVTLFLIIYILLTREKKAETKLLIRAEDQKAFYSFYENSTKYKLLQVMFKGSSPELYSVRVPNAKYESMMQGKGSIKKCFIKPYMGFIHHAKPQEGISETLTRIDTSIFREGFNPWGVK